MISRGQMKRQMYYGGGEGIVSLEAGAPSIKYSGDIRPQMAMSAPDPMDALNDLAMELFGKSLDELSPKERDALDDYNSNMMAMGGRAEYGLGSIVKSVGKAVKGAVRGIGDIVSSDIGKAALLGAGAYFGIPALAGKSWGQIGTSLMSKIPSFAMPKLTENLIGKGATLLAGSALATKLFGSPEQAATMFRERPNVVAQYLRDYYMQVNPDAKPEEVDAFVQSNTAEYSSDTFAYGGRVNKAMGDTAQAAAGIEGLPFRQNQAGVGEVDLRETGGFIPPVGIKEKADDIPAMLSNNEFVFTADAVRGMGDGDVNVGAQRMYDMMKKLENGGRV